MRKDEVFELLQRLTREVSPALEGVEIRPEDSLRALGVDSVDRAEIVNMAMEAVDLNIPRVELLDAENLGELAELFVRKLAEQEG